MNKSNSNLKIMSLNYKYSLEKGSKKYICPKCSSKTFVKFINNETNEYLSDVYGRCDRETNCGYFKSPSNNEVFQIKKTNTEHTKPSFHNKNELLNTLGYESENNLICFLCANFEEKIVSETIKKYFIATCQKWNNATIFWQKDENDLIHAGKVIMYNKTTGKRSKCINGNSLINWMHKINCKDDFRLNQCLFGLHQTIGLENKIIGVVESEKTSIILSILLPEFIWVATGSKTGFKENMLKPIINYKIVAFPDKSEYEDWLLKAKELNQKGFNITVNEWLEKSNYEAGTDLADIIIELNKQK
jgi:hypothetical protein